MSSTPQSIPLTRRIQGRLAIAVGVLVAIVVAVTLVVLPGETLREGRTSAGPSNPTPTTSVRPSQGNIDHMPQTSPQGNLDHMPQTRYPGPRKVGAAVNGSPAAAVDSTASSPTMQANPDQQEITSHEAHAAFIDPAKAFDLTRSGDLRAFP
jgi:hypothetical protein